ncbi:hypothetical protein ACTFIV_008515 [Dictyostelium citrinum]
MNNENKFIYIWRIKYIRKIILSHLRNDKKYFSSKRYDRIFSCSWMIENGYFELLKEKVQRGEYLIFTHKNTFEHGVTPFGIPRSLTRRKFDNGHPIAFDNNSIFNKEKVAIHWDSNFYNHLFNNYSNYFLNYNKSITESILIEYDNQQALQVLVENFNHSLQIESFFQSLEIGSYQCSFYIFNRFKNEILKSKKHQIRIWNIVLNYSNMKNELISSEILNQRIDFIINQCQIPAITKSTDLESFVPFLFETRIYKLKLSQLLDCIKSIIHLNELFTPFITSINDKSYKLKFPKNQEIICFNSPPKSTIENELKHLNKLISQLGSNGKGEEKNKDKFKLPDIKEFESILIIFNNDQQEPPSQPELQPSQPELQPLQQQQQQQQQLNTLVCDFNQANTTNQQFELIKKLYLLLLPFTNHFNCFIDNWNFYKIRYENNYEDYKTLKQNIIVKGTMEFHSKMFGHYKDWVTERYEDNKLFEYCKNEKQLQINYINSFNNSLKNSNNNNNNNNKIFNSILKCILVNLIRLDDLELVRVLVIPDNLIFSQIDITMFLSKVKSIEMFDFIYQIIKTSELKNKIQISNITIILQRLINSNKSMLLEHFKKNYSSDYYSSVDSIDLRDKGYGFGIFKFIYDNLIDFQNFQKVCALPNISSEATVEEIKYLLDRSPKNENYSLPYSYSSYQSFFEYLVEERSEDIDKKRFSPETGRTMLFWYYIFNKEFRNNQNNNFGNGNEILEKYKSNLMNFFDDEFERNPSIMRDTISKACSINDLHFIDLIMEKAKTSTVDYRNYNVYSRTLMEVLSSIGDLEIFKYVHSKYPDLVERNLKRVARNQNELNFFICSPSIQISILNGHIDILAFILNLYREKLTIISSRSNLSYNNRQLINHFFNTNLFQNDDEK